MLMEIKNKELYKAPSMQIFEVKTEGVICASGLNDPSDYGSGDDPFNFGGAPLFF